MLIDTSGWFSIFDSAQHDHALAIELYDDSRIKVTHSYVIVEFVALSEARKKLRSDMLTFLDKILREAEIEIVWIDEPTTLEAIDLLRKRLDKGWSLCDAVSFVLMRQLGITEALTTDHHFEQAGFIKLLES